MFTQLSDYHFLFNMLLIIISTLQMAVSDEVATVNETSLASSLAKYTTHISLHGSTPPQSSLSATTIEDYTFVDKVISFIINNLNKITNILILILSSVNISLISLVYFLYILYFILFPDRMKERNSLSMKLLLIISYLHLFAFVLFQMPTFQEHVLTINNFSILVFRTIGLSKLVLAYYEGAPMCYPLNGATAEMVQCYHPLSIHGMLPVMAITVIVYIQKMITASSVYDVVERSIQNESKKAKQRQESIMDYLEMEFKTRQESKAVAFCLCF